MEFQSKFPMDFFPPKKPEKQRAKDFFFFKKPVKKIYMKKPTTKNRQDTKYLSYRLQAVIKLKQLRNMALSQTQGN